MPAYFFRNEPGAAELRGLARRESGRVCQRVLMIANMLEGMEHEEAARLSGLSRSAAYEWHNRYEEDGIEGLRDRPRPGRQPRVDAVTSARFKERTSINPCTGARTARSRSGRDQNRRTSDLEVRY
jgi:transposase